MAAVSTTENPAPPVPAADPLRDALRREQRTALLWWLPSGLTRWAGSLGGVGPIVTAYLESAWFPLTMILSAVACLGAAFSVVGLPFSFVFWLSYLGAVAYLSRYSVAESVISSVVIIVFAVVMWGLGLSPFKPTFYFIFTIVFLGVLLGLSHSSLFRRAAEQTMTIQRLMEQVGTSQKARETPGEITLGSAPSMPRPARAGGTSPGQAVAGPKAGTDTVVIGHLANLTSAPGKDAAVSSFQSALTGALGVIAGQLWRVTDQGSVLVLFKNIGPPTVSEGTTIDATTDDFLSWFLQQRRVVVFDPGERANLEKQFGESLPDPLLPMAAMGTGAQVSLLLRVTSSSRKSYTTEDRKVLALIVALAENAFHKTAVFQQG